MTIADELPAELLEHFVEPDRWGKDHHSTLLYLETCETDQNGWVDDRKMRSKFSGYPTRLADGTELYGHGDEDCVQDMIVFGFVQYRQDVDHHPGGADFDRQPWFDTRITLLPKGRELAERLRREKANRQEVRRRAP